jgi:hypothetical protein
MDQYYDFLGKNVLRWREKDFWTYHRNGIQNLGLPLKFTKIIIASLLALISQVSHPRKAVQRIVKKDARKVSLSSLVAKNEKGLPTA